MQTLYCYSPAVLPVPSDWPDHVHVLGPWLPPGSYGYDKEKSILEADAKGQLSKELMDYISAARWGFFLNYLWFSVNNLQVRTESVFRV
jgi:hypothetical protein